jgi:hypothetical protein
MHVSNINTVVFGNSGKFVWSNIDRCIWRTAQSIIDNSEFLIGKMCRKFIDNQTVKIKMVAFNEYYPTRPYIVKTALPNDPLYLMSNASYLETYNDKAIFNKWGDESYDLNTKLYGSVGNLTLLPSALNISVSNKSWKAKLLYYQHIGNKEPQKNQELEAKAEREGINLNSSTIELLQKCNYQNHITPILEVGENSQWDAELVSKRADRILEIMWDKVITWLE